MEVKVPGHRMTNVNSNECYICLMGEKTLMESRDDIWPNIDVTWRHRNCDLSKSVIWM